MLLSNASTYFCTAAEEVTGVRVGGRTQGIEEEKDGRWRVLPEKARERERPYPRGEGELRECVRHVVTTAWSLQGHGIWPGLLGRNQGT